MPPSPKTFRYFVRRIRSAAAIRRTSRQPSQREPEKTKAEPLFFGITPEKTIRLIAPYHVADCFANRRTITLPYASPVLIV
jgi:hypothetical protein